MGQQVVIETPYKTFLQKWKHKLFGCPTFWKSLFHTLLKSKPLCRCPKCQKAIHCYWDGHDTKEGIDICNKCLESIPYNKR